VGQDEIVRVTRSSSRKQSKKDAWANLIFWYFIWLSFVLYVPFGMFWIAFASNKLHR
jgi:hypothetical protein